MAQWSISVLLGARCAAVFDGCGVRSVAVTVPRSWPCRSGYVERILADTVAKDGDGMTFERRFQDRLRGLRSEVEHADRDTGQFQRGGADRRFQLVEFLFRRPSFMPHGCVPQKTNEACA